MTSRSEKTQSHSRRRVYSAITFALPVVVILLVEAALRIGGYGGDMGLVVRREIRGRSMYMINRSAARRYFSQHGVAVPELAEDMFEVKKAPGTKRIFFLGESTMAGFPYEHNATAPSFLGDQLRALLPGTRFEIVNVGLSAVGSAVVDDCIGELVGYEPDLFVVYVGHNEFYGVYGAASAAGTGFSPWLTRLNFRLLRFKTYLALRDAYSWASSRFASGRPGSGSTLMGQVVGDEEIRLGGMTYRAGLAMYRDNLRSIITKAQASGVPVLFSTVVSNIGEMPPFRSALPGGWSEAERAGWMRSMDSIDVLLAEERTDEAALALDSLRLLAPMAARATYTKGLLSAKRGLDDDARSFFMSARDQDVLRFRATEEFQDTLLAVCRVARVPVSRVDSVFIAVSPHGIPGAGLFLEHLHPTLTGYLLMARSWCRSIYEAGLLAPGSSWRWNSELSDSALFDQAGVGEFDRAVARIKVDELTHRWPFTEKERGRPFVPATPVESIVVDFLRRGLAWSEARYRVAEYYASVHDFISARRECRAVARALPFSPEPLLRMADLFRREGFPDRARATYRESIERGDTPQARMNLTVLLFEGGKPGEASREMETAFRVAETAGFTLPVDVAAAAHLLLGNAYLQTNRPGDAREEYRRVLMLRPDDPEAQRMLRLTATPAP